MMYTQAIVMLDLTLVSDLTLFSPHHYMRVLACFTSCAWSSPICVLKGRDGNDNAYFACGCLSISSVTKDSNICIFLRSSPGAASPLSSIAIRLTGSHGCLLGLGPHNSEDFVTWRGVLFDIVGSW